MRFLFILFTLILICCNTLVGQFRIEPFPTHNQSPLIHFFGMPVNTGGKVLGKGEFIFNNYLNISNSATRSRILEEAIYLDGELYRNDFSVRYGLSKKLELGINIPLVKHAGGIMDPFIKGWHSAFGLPGKSREVMPNQHLAYMYMENNEAVLLMEKSEFDIGDISLNLATQLFKGEYNNLTIKVFFKFATGDKTNLIGSGTNDYGIQISGENTSIIKSRNLSFFYSTGFLKIGSGALLSDKLSKNLFFGNIGCGVKLKNKFIPKLQFDFHSEFYKQSATKQLGNKSIQMVLGTDYLVTNTIKFSASFTEDLIVNTSPDFVLQFGVSFKL